MQARAHQPIGHEIHRPDQVRGFWNCQFIGLLPLQPAPRLDPQVQLQLAVDPVDPLVVPDMSFGRVANVVEIAEQRAPGM